MSDVFGPRRRHRRRPEPIEHATDAEIEALLEEFIDTDPDDVARPRSRWARFFGIS